MRIPNKSTLYFGLGLVILSLIIITFKDNNNTPTGNVILESSVKEWNFLDVSSYSYSNSLNFSKGVVKLNKKSNAIFWDFTDWKDYNFDKTVIDVSLGKAKLIPKEKEKPLSPIVFSSGYELIKPIYFYDIQPIDKFNYFKEFAQKPAGEVYYQIFNGKDWYYWNSSTWIVAKNDKFNTAFDINTNIQSLKLNKINSTVGVKIFIHSDGHSQIELDRIEIGFDHYEKYGEIDTDGYYLKDNKIKNISFIGIGDLEYFYSINSNDLWMNIPNSYFSDLSKINGNVKSIKFRAVLKSSGKDTPLLKSISLEHN